ncbi:MAG: Na+/H+ antiporter NhaA [Ignavibacteriaceae bacterium]|jgi:NhaA family Na+:H+ antiporter|nr:Na+/H+ antiporter NhaA [Ignavibacteriaceae bacterium]MCU0364973.1 Na+/H+ antiporter NhaA [Ignavibacteriaceae bacterium]MCU0413809.1 Na+/H+ antiporter NhaA [Ignavibacteriaceae bacterium]
MQHKKEPIEVLLKPINQFLHQEASGGILLMICTVIALVWANSPWSESYHHLWHTPLVTSLGNLLNLDYTLHYWINDGLMAIFFFTVGLEIKRELLVGELSSLQKASLPIAGALGGMVVPAIIYTIFNSGGEGANGWGIPMATDIAFVVGLMALLGNRVPLSLKIFILALAIADDIGAVMVIAIFYTAEISSTALIIAAIVLIVLIILNRLGTKSLVPYTVLGVILWLAFLKSGIHATIAGVILAFTIPATSRYDTKKFSDKVKELIKNFDAKGDHWKNVLNNSDRQHDVMAIEASCEKVLTPLQRFEHGLHPWVAFFIIPIFALANAGVTIADLDILSALLSPISLGIILGLFIGKQMGIFVFSFLAVKLKFATLPEGVNWKNLYGAAILAGIGFTMSLFIASLAFADPALLDLAKIGILSGSLLSGIAGFMILKTSSSKK